MATLDQTATAQIWKSCAGDCAVCCVAQLQALLTHILQSSPPPLSNVFPRCRIVQSKTRPLHRPPFGSPHAQPFLAQLPGIRTAMFARHSAPSSSRLKTAQTRENGCSDAKASHARNCRRGRPRSRHPQFRPKNAAVAQHRIVPRCCPSRCRRLNAAARTQGDQRHVSLWLHDFTPSGRRVLGDAASIDAEPHVARRRVRESQSRGSKHRAVLVNMPTSGALTYLWIASAGRV